MGEKWTYDDERLNSSSSTDWGPVISSISPYILLLRFCLKQTLHTRLSVSCSYIGLTWVVKFVRTVGNIELISVVEKMITTASWMKSLHTSWRVSPETWLISSVVWRLYLAFTEIVLIYEWKVPTKTSRKVMMISDLASISISRIRNANYVMYGVLVPHCHYPKGETKCKLTLLKYKHIII